MSQFTREYGNFAPVMEYCAREDVRLHPDIAVSARYREVVRSDSNGVRRGLMYECYVPTAAHAAFAAVTEFQRTTAGDQPTDLLTSQPIDRNAPASTTNMVIDVLNSKHLDEETRQKAGEISFAQGTTHRLGVCEWTDVRMAHAMTAFAATSPLQLCQLVEGKREAGFQLFMHNERPLLLRKDGIKSALSFAPIVVGDCVYPAGTVYKLQVVPNTPANIYDAGKRNQSMGRVEVIGASSILSAAAMRLSVYALEPGPERDKAVSPYEAGRLGRKAENITYDAVLHELRERAANIAGLAIQAWPEIHEQQI